MGSPLEALANRIGGGKSKEMYSATWMTAIAGVTSTGAPPSDPQPGRTQSVPYDGVHAQRRFLSLDRYVECTTDTACGAVDRICVAGWCVPRCVDSDAGFAEDLGDAKAQAFTPGRVTTYFPALQSGKKIWQKMTASDGCKTDRWLVEYSCLLSEDEPSGIPQMQFQAIKCPPATRCLPALNTKTQQWSAVCQPVNVPTCTPTWQPLGVDGPSGAVSAVLAVDGDLYAGSALGIHWLTEGSTVWVPQVVMNGQSAVITQLVTTPGHPFALQQQGDLSSTVLQRSASGIWTNLSGAPGMVTALGAHPTLEVVYVGHASGVAWHDVATQQWGSLGNILADGVSYVGVVANGPLLAGGPSGLMSQWNVGAALWQAMLMSPSQPDLPILTAIRFADRLFAGLTGGLVYCNWPTTQPGPTGCHWMYNTKSVQETAAHHQLLTSNEHLYAARADGVAQYDPWLDYWFSINDAALQAPVWSLTEWLGVVIAGTASGVMVYQCPE